MTELKKSIAGSSILIVLGLLGMYGGIRSLVLLLPAAILVYYEWSASSRRSKDHPLGPTAGTARRD